MTSSVNNLWLEISSSKKYKHLDPGFIKQVIEIKKQSTTPRNLKKEVVKTLHQVWAAYLSSLPDYDKLLSNLKKDLETQTVKNALTRALSFHSSSRERLEDLSSFYESIFKVTGRPRHILDLGCGLNPLTIPWMNLDEKTKYEASDIDHNEVSFLNGALKTLGIKNASVEVANTLTAKAKKAQIVFMLKLLPVLESLSSGAGLSVIKKQKAEWIVVSFPTKSIGGKEKGMEEYYRSWFLKLTASLRLKITEIVFKNEIAFILKC